MTKLLNSSRQLRHPKEFRITLIDHTSVEQSPLREADAETGEAKIADRDNADQRKDVRKLLGVMAAIATCLWRMTSRTSHLRTLSVPQEIRHWPRHLATAIDALRAAGIEIKDYTNVKYTPGMAVNPIAFQPTEGIDAEIIQETVKPAVLYGKKLIQRADVIVARPVSAKERAIPDEHSVSNEKNDKEDQEWNDE